jgi:SAM-dependent methyltransferase
MILGQVFVRMLQLCLELAGTVDLFYHRATNQARKLRRVMEKAAFGVLGRKPGTFGYPAYREATLAKALELKPFLGSDLPLGFGSHCDERIVEYPWLLESLPAGRGRLLDAGSVLNSDLVLKHPKLREKQITITTLAPEDQAHWWKGVSYTYEDIRELSFRDSYFDSVVCISTLEHVGMDNARFYTRDGSKRETSPSDYLVFMDQLRRVLKTGGTLYLTVPFGRYSNEGWLQVFDSALVEQLIARFNPSRSEAHFFKYQSHQWQRSTRETCSGAGYFSQNDKLQNAEGIVAAESVCCLMLVK